MEIQAIESAAFAAWPALEELNTPMGILRYDNGISRRTNSMNPSYARTFDPKQVIATSECFFAERFQPSIVRVLATRQHISPSHYLLDTMLGEAGYSLESPTRVMWLDMTAEPGAGTNSAASLSVGMGQWLVAWRELKALTPESFRVHKQLLARIKGQTYFALRCDKEDRPVAAAMAVVCGAYLGVYGVVTGKTARRQGYAQSMLGELLFWGQGQGARYAYLQVEEANTAAIHLYEKFGFKEAYSYWYRCKPLSALLVGSVKRITNKHESEETRS